jgi:hypothetical protein
MSDVITKKVVDKYQEHAEHLLYNKDCSTCWGENLVIKHIDKDNLTDGQILKLQEYFNTTQEYFGIPIYKDNCEDLFENWLEGLSKDEVLSILNKSNE